MATTWTPIASVVQTAIPNDITGNSLSLAPVAGDATAVALKLGNGSATLFNVDASGNISAAAATLSSTLTVNSNATVTGTLRVNGQATLASSSVTGNESVGGTLTTATLSVTGNETIGGTETVTGLLTANGNIATPLIKTTQGPTSQTINSTSYSVANVQLPGSFGDGNNYPLSGISSDSLGNLSVNYQGVPAIKMANPGYNSTNGTTPGTAFPTTFQSGAYNFNAGGNTLLNLSATSAKFGFTSNTVPVVMQALSGNILQLQNSGSSPSFNSQVVGTVDTNGNLVLSGNASAVNGVFGGTLKASGATTLAGASVTSLTNSGNETISGTLNVTGASTLGALTATAVTSTGTSTAAAFTISASGGKLTFGDGTSQTTAPTSPGSASTFTATANGTTAAPAFSFTANTDTGAYLKTASTTAAVLGLSVNATDAMTLTKTGVSVPGNMAVTGISSGNVLYANAAGSATNPVISNASFVSTGLYFTSTPAVIVTAGGTAAASFSATAVSCAQPLVAQSTLAVTGTSTLTGQTTTKATVTSTTAVGTPSFVSTQGFKSYYDMGSLIYASGATLPTSPTQLMRNGTAYNRSFIPAVPTSIMGVSVGLQQTLTTAVTISMNVNGTTTTLGTIAAGSSSFSVSYSKGTYNLAAGNYFYLNASFASSSGQTNPVQMDANALIEMGA